VDSRLLFYYLGFPGIKGRKGKCFCKLWNSRACRNCIVAQKCAAKNYSAEAIYYTSLHFSA
jgi:hypothetical protein